MIVKRVTVQYLSGKVQEALSLIEEERNRIKYPHTRYYIPHDKENVIIGEFEYENAAEMDKFMSTIDADPGMQHFRQKHDALKDGVPAVEHFDVFVGK